MAGEEVERMAPVGDLQTKEMVEEVGAGVGLVAGLVGPEVLKSKLFAFLFLINPIEASLYTERFGSCYRWRAWTILTSRDLK